MTHVTDDDLLLFSYAELDAAAAAQTTAHLAACADCHARLARLERARVAADWALARRPRVRLRRTALAGLAVAAALAIVLLRGRTGAHEARLTLTVPRYAAPELAPIDSLLTRLEKEKPYAIP
jgi:hypothetical protein